MTSDMPETLQPQDFSNVPLATSACSYNVFLTHKMQRQSFVTYCMLTYCIRLVILKRGEFSVDVIKVFSKNVKAYRTQLGFSQEHFAEKAGLHRTYISAIECGKRSISLDNIQKIADALQIDTYLLFIDQENFNQKGGEG